RDMGVESVDDLTLVQHFRDAALMPQDLHDEPLRFASDWRAPMLGLPGQFLPGWNRPIRVGVFISHASASTRSNDGEFHPVELQGRLANLIVDPGFQLVSIAERGSTELAPIERTIREYELLGGLIDAADAEELGTLDVIILGINFAMAPAVARAFAEAVRGG